MRNSIYKLAILLISLVVTQAAFADVKIKSKQTVSGQSYENTTYIKGKRQRTESMNGMMINLNQCDLQRGIQINPQTKTYVINEYQQAAAAAEPGKPAVKNDGVVRAGGTVNTTITVKDTGERKQMFGFTAKHLIITMETVSSPDACTKNNTKMQTDGWYIDAEFVLDCNQNAQYAPYRPTGANKPICQDKYTMKQVGTTKRGYPVYEKMTMFDETGKETMSMVNEVVELSKATLETGLFDVPADYRQVSDAAQMYSAGNYGSSSTSSTSSTSMGARTGSYPGQGVTGVSGNLSKLSQNSTTSPSPVGAKKEGTVRIGLAAVKTGAVGEGVNAADLSAAIQNTLTQYLKVPNVEVITLDARLSSAIESEARQKECDYVLYINAAHKKGGGGGGLFGSILAPAIGRMGIGHTGSAAGNVAGQAATQSIVSAGSASQSIKPKDELTLDVKLQQIGGAATLARQFKKKASSNGEDIITPVVEEAATAIVDLVGK